TPCRSGLHSTTPRHRGQHMNVTWWSAILLCLAGGAGAAARFMVDGWVRSFTTDRFPVGTMIINVVGSAAFGVVVGVAIARDLPDAWELIVGGGFLGGFTTLSTASFETIALIRQRRHLAAAFNAVGTLVLSVAVA